MNEQFFHLPEEKQQAIINASLEVFATHEYKKASTDDIAAKAGISKGLLFYYFHNKKSLYLFLYDYTKKLVTDQVIDTILMKSLIFLSFCPILLRKRRPSCHATPISRILQCEASIRKRRKYPTV